MLEVRPDDVLHLAENVVLHAIPELEKYWAFQVETGDQYELNETAYFLLAQFREPRDVVDGLRAFCDQFETDTTTVETDCLPLLGRYLQEGIFQRR